MPAAPRIIERLRWVTDTVRDHVWLHKHLGIRPTDLVLDVGSGGSPNLRSDVLCDKFATDTVERNGLTILADRPLVIGDACRLPFADQSFDFVICSHLLEHVEDPGAVIRELCRVAPRGYIETPAAEWEKLRGFPFHRWMVTNRDGVLSFEPKRARIHDPALREWFFNTARSLGTWDAMYFGRRRLGMLTSLRWERTIPFEVHGSADERLFEQARLDGESDAHEAPVVSPRSARVASAASRLLRRASTRPWSAIERLLRCPDCGVELARLADDYLCTRCARAFPVDAQGHPWLLPGEP